jgi:hypothetical protein
MLSRVFLLPVRGDLTSALTNSLVQALHARTLFKPAALLLSVNSRAGCELQAHKLADAVRGYGRRHSCMTVAFAEDYCLGPSMLLLSEAHRCYASPISLLGNLRPPYPLYNWAGNILGLKHRHLGDGPDPLQGESEAEIRPVL